MLVIYLFIPKKNLLIFDILILDSINSSKIIYLVSYKGEQVKGEGKKILHHPTHLDKRIRKFYPLTKMGVKG